MPPELLDAIRQRFSCRDFAADAALTAAELAMLREAGRLAPSAFGLEPWRFVSVTDAAGRARVAEACFGQPAATTATAVIVVVALVAVLDPDSPYVADRLAAEARGTDVAALLAAYREMYAATDIEGWALAQCHLAAAHVLLQATHMGLGSCPLGGFDRGALHAALALPAGEVPALAIALGRCRQVAPERLRKPLD